MKRTIASRLYAIMTAAAAVCITVPAVPVHAENFQFITDVRLASGENAQDELEEAGYSVMAVGLNAPLSETQVYLGYKLNGGTPITNLLIAPDTGDTVNVGGVQYTCAAHVDVDEGIGGGAGCVYYTRDDRAGKPLVALNVLRADVEKGEELLPIPNDGAEVVRRPDGAPADLEPNSQTALMYLTQIRDGIVRPYISEVVPVTDTDRWNAVYTAAQFGYNYFIDGDIDNSSDTYTLLAYRRTADPLEAVTGITAVSAAAVQALEDQANSAENATLTGNVIGISGVEYVRTSAQAVPAETPYYLYFTTDRAAGNPISMLYANAEDGTAETLFGTWVSGFFASKGVSHAYVYAMNEDLMKSLEYDMTVCVQIPVHLLQTPGEEAPDITTQHTAETTVPAETTAAESDTADKSDSTAAAETTVPAETVDAADTTDTTAAETITAAESTTESTPAVTGTYKVQTGADVQTVAISYQTFRDGLPENLAVLNGLRSSDRSTPILDHTQRAERDSKYQASVFSGGWYMLIAGAAAILIAVILAGMIRSKPAQSKAVKQAAAPGPMKKQPPKQPVISQKNTNTGKPKSGGKNQKKRRKKK